MWNNTIESIINAKTNLYSVKIHELFYIFRTNNCNQIFNFKYFFVISIIDEVSDSISILEIPSLYLSQFIESVSITCSRDLSRGVFKGPCQLLTISISTISTSKEFNFCYFIIFKVFNFNFPVFSCLSNKDKTIKEFLTKVKSSICYIDPRIFYFFLNFLLASTYLLILSSNWNNTSYFYQRSIFIYCL